MALENKKILITVITQTGFNLATRLFASKDVEIRYLPFEFLVFKWRFDALKTLVVLEAEMWFGLFDFAKLRGAKTLLANARISDRSYERYLKFRFYYQAIFRRIDSVWAQSQNDLIRLESLGAKNVKVCGNLKIYSKIEPTKLYNKPQKTLIVAGSTHFEEEKIVLSAFLDFHQKNPQSMLVLAPRHPERFDEVHSLLNGLKTARVSNAGFDESQDILLLDVLGELDSFYRIADIVILCGSFVKVGGHNPLEPAFFETRLISGPYIFNQYSLFDCIENYFLVQDVDELRERLLKWEEMPKSKIKIQKQGLELFIREITDE